MAKPIRIRAESVSKIFGPRPDEAHDRLQAGASKDEIYHDTGCVVAVSEVSFEVSQGEIFVVMGLSGSGKSTLIRCLNRLIEPTSGKVLLDDEDILAADRKHLRQIRRTKMGMVFQHFALFPHMTVGENVAYGLKVQGIHKNKRREQALDALDQVGLRPWADTAIRNLSGGMQQRVGLARGLAANSEILLMDEPFSALDPLIRRDMQHELLNLQEHMHKTIVFITHDLNEALILGDQIAIMKDGRFVQVGSAQEIVANPTDPYVAAFTQEVDRSRVFTLGAMMEKVPTLTLDTDSPERARELLKTAERAFIYVQDKQGRPIGVLGNAALEKSKHDDIAALMSRDFPQGETEQRLYQSFELCSSGLPIAVVDANTGQLQGVVDPLNVFSELTPGEAPEEAETANQTN